MSKKVIKWITSENLQEIEQNVYTDLGTFVDYKYKEVDFDEEYKDALIRELVNNGYVICGDTHQYKCIPVFEGNVYIELSMRKWGELMAEVMNLASKEEKYTYKDFYLARFRVTLEILPNG